MIEENLSWGAENIVALLNHLDDEYGSGFRVDMAGDRSDHPLCRSDWIRIKTPDGRYLHFCIPRIS
jgi:hypothetical protein